MQGLCPSCPCAAAPPRPPTLFASTDVIHPFHPFVKIFMNIPMRAFILMWSCGPRLTLAPLVYPHLASSRPLPPLVPPSPLQDYLAAPMPYLVGIQADCLPLLRGMALEETVLIDLDRLGSCTPELGSPGDDYFQLPFARELEDVFEVCFLPVARPLWTHPWQHGRLPRGRAVQLELGARVDTRTPVLAQRRPGPPHHCRLCASTSRAPPSSTAPQSAPSSCRRVQDGHPQQQRAHVTRSRGRLLVGQRLLLVLLLLRLNLPFLHGFIQRRTSFCV